MRTARLTRCRLPGVTCIPISERYSILNQVRYWERYNIGITAASGTTTAHTSLAKAFVLDSSSGLSYFGTYDQIQIFNTDDFTRSGATIIPVSIAISSSNGTISYTPTRLRRWGSNGLAFRTGGGVYSLRSNTVKDLSSTSADLGVLLCPPVRPQQGPMKPIRLP